MSAAGLIVAWQRQKLGAWAGHVFGDYVAYFGLVLYTSYHGRKFGVAVGTVECNNSGRIIGLWACDLYECCTKGIGYEMCDCGVASSLLVYLERCVAMSHEEHIQSAHTHPHECKAHRAH